MLKQLIDAIARLYFGHNTVDNAKEWHAAHTKARQSRAEVERIIREHEEAQANQPPQER